MIPVSPATGENTDHPAEMDDEDRSEDAQEEAVDMSTEDAESDRRPDADEGDEKLVCMPCEDQEGIDEEVDIEAEIQRAAGIQVSRRSKSAKSTTLLMFHSDCGARHVSWAGQRMLRAVR